jgi:hypothetical protein
LLSCSTYTPLWLVRRLSMFFPNAADLQSIHFNATHGAPARVKGHEA